MWIFGLFILVVLASLWVSFLPASEDDETTKQNITTPQEFPSIVLDVEESPECDGPMDEELPTISQSVEPEPRKEAA